MRIVKNTPDELIITTFSRWLLAVICVLALVTVAGAWYATARGAALFLYAVIPVAILCVFFIFAASLMSSRAYFSNKSGKVTLKSRGLFRSVRRSFNLDFFRYARIHTIQLGDPVFEVVLVFSEQILYDPDQFDADALVKHRQLSREAGREPYEISMTSGADSIYKFSRKQEVVDVINDWRGVSLPQ